MKNILQDIRQELKKQIDKNYKEDSCKYFQNTVTLHGVRLHHKTNMPRVALRYAIEKMPDSLRKKAMQMDEASKR